MSFEAPERTRDKILHLLLTRGPKTTSEMAEAIGVTGMAIRQHLQGLEGDNLVDSTREKRPVGRPALVWRLSDEGRTHFPTRYEELAIDLIELVRERFGEAALEELLAARSERQAARYRGVIAQSELSDLGAKVARLCELREAEGFLAEFEADADGGFLLYENHCPIGEAARCSGCFCSTELDLFHSVLGPDVSIARVEHMHDADHRRCAYRIRPQPDAISL